MKILARKQNQSGYVMIAMLVTMVLISIFATILIRLTRVSSENMIRDVAGDQSFYDAESAIRITLFHITEDPDNIYSKQTLLFSSGNIANVEVESLNEETYALAVDVKGTNSNQKQHYTIPKFQKYIPPSFVFGDFGVMSGGTLTLQSDSNIIDSYNGTQIGLGNVSVATYSYSGDEDWIKGNLTYLDEDYPTPPQPTIPPKPETMPDLGFNTVMDGGWYRASESFFTQNIVFSANYTSYVYWPEGVDLKNRINWTIYGNVVFVLESGTSFIMGPRSQLRLADSDASLKIYADLGENNDGETTVQLQPRTSTGEITDSSKVQIFIAGTGRVKLMPMNESSMIFYAPGVDLQLQPNGNYFGAVIANNIDVQPNRKIYYDEALNGKPLFGDDSDNGSTRKYLINRLRSYRQVVEHAKEEIK